MMPCRESCIDMRKELTEDTVSKVSMVSRHGNGELSKPGK